MAGDIETAQLSLEDVKFDGNGLVPCIVQDVDTKNVLMMAWMNADSLQRSVEERTTWFWSRSRQRLWHKGEESGNTQELVALHYDCDADTLLALVHPEGPACHTGNYTCFYRTFPLPDNGKEPELGAHVEDSPLQHPGFREKLGIQLVEESPERVLMKMPIVPSVTQPAGFLHGGATLTLLETAASWASWLSADLDAELSFGSHIDVRHISAAKKGCIYGVAELQQVEEMGGRGRKEHWAVTASGEDGRVISTGIITTRVVSKEYFANRKQ